MSNVKPDAIFQIGCGFMASKLFFVANDVGLFEKLADGPATLDELIQRIGAPRRTVRILVDAMAALGLLKIREGQYENGPAAASFLSGRGEEDLRPLLRYFEEINYPMWMKLKEAVRTGEPVFKDLTLTEGEQHFTRKASKHLPSRPQTLLPQPMILENIVACWTLEEVQDLF